VVSESYNLQLHLYREKLSEIANVSAISKPKIDNILGPEAEVKDSLTEEKYP
jgi:hypothetical protein